MIILSVLLLPYLWVEKTECVLTQKEAIMIAIDASLCITMILLGCLAFSDSNVDLCGFFQTIWT